MDEPLSDSPSLNHTTEEQPSALATEAHGNSDMGDSGHLAGNQLTEKASACLLAKEANSCDCVLEASGCRGEDDASKSGSAPVNGSQVSSTAIAVCITERQQAAAVDCSVIGDQAAPLLAQTESANDASQSASTHRQSAACALPRVSDYTQSLADSADPIQHRSNNCDSVNCSIADASMPSNQFTNGQETDSSLLQQFSRAPSDAIMPEIRHVLHQNAASPHLNITDNGTCISTSLDSSPNGINSSATHVYTTSSDLNPAFEIINTERDVKDSEFDSRDSSGPSGTKNLAEATESILILPGSNHRITLPMSPGTASSSSESRPGFVIGVSVTNEQSLPSRTSSNENRGTVHSEINKRINIELTNSIVSLGTLDNTQFAPTGSGRPFKSKWSAAASQQAMQFEKDSERPSLNQLASVSRQSSMALPVSIGQQHAAMPMPFDRIDGARFPGFPAVSSHGAVPVQMPFNNNMTSRVIHPQSTFAFPPPFLPRHGQMYSAPPVYGLPLANMPSNTNGPRLADDRQSTPQAYQFLPFVNTEHITQSGPFHPSWLPNDLGSAQSPDTNNFMMPVAEFSDSNATLDNSQMLMHKLCLQHSPVPAGLEQSAVGQNIDHLRGSQEHFRWRQLPNAAIDAALEEVTCSFDNRPIVPSLTTAAAIGQLQHADVGEMPRIAEGLSDTELEVDEPTEYIPQKQPAVRVLSSSKPSPFIAEQLHQVPHSLFRPSLSEFNYQPPLEFTSQVPLGSPVVRSNESVCNSAFDREQLQRQITNSFSTELLNENAINGSDGVIHEHRSYPVIADTTIKSAVGPGLVSSSVPTTPLSQLPLVTSAAFGSSVLPSVYGRVNGVCDNPDVAARIRRTFPQLDISDVSFRPDCQRLADEQIWMMRENYRQMLEKMEQQQRFCEQMERQLEQQLRLRQLEQAGQQLSGGTRAGGGNQLPKTASDTSLGEPKLVGLASTSSTGSMTVTAAASATAQSGVGPTASSSSASLSAATGLGKHATPSVAQTSGHGYSQVKDDSESSSGDQSSSDETPSRWFVPAVPGRVVSGSSNPRQRPRNDMRHTHRGGRRYKGLPTSDDAVVSFGPAASSSSSSLPRPPAAGALQHPGPPPSGSDASEASAHSAVANRAAIMDAAAPEYDTDEETDRLLDMHNKGALLSDRAAQGGSAAGLDDSQSRQSSRLDQAAAAQAAAVTNADAQRLLEQRRRQRIREVTMPDPDDPSVLLEGILFRARYLGSTQLISEGQPSKHMRMMQAHEVVGRIKVADGETQPSTDVDLLVSTEKLLVINAQPLSRSQRASGPTTPAGSVIPTSEQNLPATSAAGLATVRSTQGALDAMVMMNHSLRTISYIADIDNILVVMARRRTDYFNDSSPASAEPGGSMSSATSRQSDIQSLPSTSFGRVTKILCHVFESEDAQLIAQTIGQAFHVAYLEFLRANGIDDPNIGRDMDYQDVLNQQEIFNQELQVYSDKQRHKEVVVPKRKGEAMGVMVVESGWGSLVPTVVLANMHPEGPAARCGQLNIGDQIMSVNGLSMVGLPLAACQASIKNTRQLNVVRLSIVQCPPVVEVLIKRPDVKYQLGFSVQNGVICSLLRGGIAERGGIRVGHRIIEINGQSVVAVAHERIVQMLANSVGEIHMKTMPTAIFRLLTGQEQPIYI